jgi:hypothetical protein
MTTRHEAIERALATATEAMHAKGKVQPMIIAHAANALMAFPLAGMIGREMRKSVTPGFMSSCPRRRWQWMDGKTRRHLNDPIEDLVLPASDDEGDSVATYRGASSSAAKIYGSGIHAILTTVVEAPELRLFQERWPYCTPCRPPG